MVSTKTCVLFDLDGTLADTAPDLSAALNYLRRKRGLAELPLSTLRKHCSGGARALLREGFGLLPEAPAFEAFRQEFLEYYAQCLTQQSQLFPKVSELLLDLEKQACLWGVVTNKAQRFSSVLCEHLKITDKAACIVSGDTTPYLKPNPASLLYASEHCQVSPTTCYYVGDDKRDILAGQSAGMRTIAIRWGYGEDVEQWEAHYIADKPSDVLRIVLG